MTKKNGMIKNLKQLYLTIVLGQIALFSVGQNNTNSVMFDGADDYISVPNNAALNPTANISVEAWIKADAWGANYWDNTIVGKDYWFGPITGYSLRVGDNGRLSFVLAIGGTWHEAVSAPIMSTGIWYFVSGVYDGSSIKLYINDSLVALYNVTGAIVPSWDNLNIGKCPNPTALYPRMFDGKIDQVEVWDLALDSASIYQNMMCSPDGTESGLVGFWNFEEGTGTITSDLTSNNDDGTLVNGAMWSNDTQPICVPTCTNSASTITVSACESYLAPSTVETFFSSGIYTDTLPNNAGCDSIITINLTITQPTLNTITANACSNYTLNSQTFTTSGTYTQNLTNSAGCDSTITLNLTINQPSTNTITASACSDYTLNSQTYTTSGTYNQTLTNVSGCDSTITLNLTINQPTTNTITTSACNNYSLNSQTYTTSGTYTQTLTNAEGCDSTLTLNLTITAIDNSVTLTGSTLISNQNGAAYQWLNCPGLNAIPGETNISYSPNDNGIYAVEISLNGCVDISNCFEISELGNEDFENTNFHIYPNPFNDKLTVEFKGRITSYVLFDTSGKIIYEANGKRTSPILLDLSDLQTGLYILQIKTEENQILNLKISKI